MATLEKIRNKAGVLIAVVIGVSLVAFILTDLLSSGTSIVMGNPNELAVIEGQTVEIGEFNQTVESYVNFYQNNYGQNIDDVTRIQVRNQVWNEFVQMALLQKEAKKIGFNVSDEELADIVQGQNPHPLVRQSFTNEQGMFDKNRLAMFLQNWDMLEPDQQGQWMFIENIVYKERFASKYAMLTSKALYTTDLEAKSYNSRNGKKVSFDYIKLPYSDIADSTITISDSEIKSYVNKHKGKFEQDASRDISFVVFPVNPSIQDDQDTKNSLIELKEDFAKTENTAQFVNGNSDSAYVYLNKTQDQLPEEIAEFMFSNEEGAVYGPYFSRGAYRLSKLAAINYVPDSVSARHILIKSMTFEQADKLADSIIDVVESGNGRFADLAQRFSEDPGSKIKGGDLGWFQEGMMVKPFNDSVFYGEEGDIVKVMSQFGLHIIEILDQSKKVKKVQVGTIVREVQASNETFNEVYAQANEFAGKNNTYDQFVSAANAQGLAIRSANKLDKNAFAIPGYQNAREVVKWAWGANKKEVTDNTIEVGDDLIIAAVKEIHKEGLPSAEEVKNAVSPILMNQKKAEILKEKIADANNSSIESLAEELNVTLSSASNISFDAFTVAGAGVEPKLAATVTVYDKGETTSAIEGNTGVYVAHITETIEAPALENYDFAKQNMSQQGMNQGGAQTFEALKEISNVKDNRALFY